MPEIDLRRFIIPRVGKLFPLADVKNIRLFYLLTIFNNAWFIAANWFFFWTRFMTYGQLGVVDGTAFAFGLLMEIPSGAVSDLIGKKKTIAAAMFLLALSILIIAVSSSLAVIWIAFFFTQLGWALYSGSGEALAYDSLVEQGKEDRYEEVISFSGAIAGITTIAAILIGGVLYVINFRLPHLAFGFAYLIAFFIALGLIEPKVDIEKFPISAFFKQLLEGTKQLLQPAVKPFLIVIFALLGAHFLYDWGLVKPAIAAGFGFFDREQAVIFALIALFNSLIITQIPKFRRHVSDKKGLYLLSFLMGVGFLLAFFNLKYFGLIPMLLIAASGCLAYPWVSIVVNREIPSQYRATTLSAVAFLTKVPYVALAIIAGKMAGMGSLNVFNLCVGAAVVLGTLASLCVFSFAVRKREN